MTDRRWFIGYGSEQYGPFTQSEIEAMRARGEIDPELGAYAVGGAAHDSVSGKVGGGGSVSVIIPMGPFWRVLRAAIALSLMLTVGYVAWMTVDALRYQADPVGYWDVQASVSATLAELVLLWIHGVVGVITTILFLRYTYRGMKNTHVIAPPDAKLISPGWAVGWYFIPVANLWMPLLAVRQMFRHSVAPDAREHSIDRLISIWWGLWLISNLLIFPSAYLAFQATNWDGNLINESYYAISLWIDVIGSVFYAFASVAVLGFFGVLARAQDEWGAGQDLR